MIVFTRLLRRLTVAAVLLTPGHALAESYAGGGIGLFNFEVGNARFQPLIADLHAGWRTLRGPGIEIRAANGLRDDEVDRASLDLRWVARGYATWSFYSSVRTATFTLGMGYAGMQIDTKVGNSDFPGKQTYNGAAFMVRAAENFSATSPWGLTLSYEHLYFDDRLSASAIALGAVYAF